MTAIAPLPQPPVRLRLSTPDDVLEALPYLLGFHPQESLVAVSIRGPRHRIGLHLRMDLPRTAAAEQQVAQLVAAHLAHDGAEEAVVVVYTDECGAAETPAEGDGQLRRPLVEAVRGALGVAGVGLRDALLVSRGHWWSYLCADPGCCPGEGTPLRPASGSSSEVAATAAYAGLSALPSRADLAASLRPVASVARAAMEQALDRAADQLLDRLLHGASRAALRAEHREMLEQALADAAGGRPPPGDEVSARLILGLADVPLRDEVITWAVRDEGEALQQLLIHLVRRAIPPDDVAVATVLGAIAYQQGNGTIAGMAIERALASDPAYQMARILDEALQRGVPPEALREHSIRTSGRGCRGEPGPDGRGEPDGKRGPRAPSGPVDGSGGTTAPRDEPPAPPDEAGSA